MRRNPLYNSYTEEDEILQRLSSIYTIDDYKDEAEPEIDYEPSPKSGSKSAWYLRPFAKPESDINTSKVAASDSRGQTLVQVSGPDGSRYDGKMHFERVYENSDSTPNEFNVFEKPDDKDNVGVFDATEILYLTPYHKTDIPVTNQPLSSDKLVQTLTKISGPPDKAPDGKLYFESVNASADNGPRIVYVLGPPGKEEPSPRNTQRSKEPGQQTIDRNARHSLDERQKSAERQISTDDIKNASPDQLKILKRVLSVVLIIIELISECITLSDMYSQTENSEGVSDAADTVNEFTEKASLECDASNATKNLTTAYTVFVCLQWLYSILRVINIIGETIEDVKGNGFQILHGWDESALSLMMIDIPETIIFIAFINQCKRKPNGNLFYYIVSCLLKNFGRKYTTRQKPTKITEVKIPFICYSFVLIDKDGNFSFSFRKEQWQFKFRMYFWDLIICRDKGCCSDTRECCFTEAAPWKCCTLLCGCFKIKLCHGEGCKELHGCKVGFWNGCKCFETFFQLLIYMIVGVFLIIVRVFQTPFTVLEHISIG